MLRVSQVGGRGGGLLLGMAVQMWVFFLNMSLPLLVTNGDQSKKILKIYTKTYEKGILSK